jgi:CRP/FNR family transcriptional regulator, cyclic AMP receptor protein
MRFGVGQDIFREGQSADHFYLIHKGTIVLDTFVPLEGGTTIQTLLAGEAFGWSWFFAPYTWHFTARAIEPAELVGFNAAHLREKAQENHDFGYDLAMRIGRVMFERLQTTRRRLVEFYMRD